MVPDFAVVVAGLLFGSFLNVCISRLPRHESIVSPRSRCPHCLTPVRSLDNIPVLSFLVLRGRCRSCRASIGWRYPAVELVMPALWLLCWLRFGATIEAGAMGVLCFLLLGLAVMDAETMHLPDAFTLPGILLGVLYAACRSGLRGLGLAILWALAAGSLIVFIRWVYRKLRGREGMGLGDAKLLAMIAAWLGPWQTLLAFFLAVVAGALFGLARMRRMEARLPLGAFLCMASLYVIFFGQATIDWYLGFFR
ncbi:prepilin peptidase [Silvibacterium acidisoli]|uniref:prepilin peptidase n=1 Tax=Acidobacteriaceae bacterium ZG23-2 TaxID=2883246 RepID=UPI00406D4130